MWLLEGRTTAEGVIFHCEEEGDELIEGVTVVKKSLVEELKFRGNVSLTGAKRVDVVEVPLDEAC